MKITVITVAYNSAATIAKTFRSVAQQTHADVEHILIDGASKDSTMEIARLEGAHLAQMKSEPDKGIYDAMNKGIALATGDVVAFLNADDFYADHDVLARVARVMEAEKLDALYGDVAFFRPEDGKIVRRYSSSSFRPDRLGYGWMPAHPALFVKRELFSRVGLFRTDFRIAGDFELIARIFREPQLKYRYLAETFVLMQTGGVSTSGLRATLLLNREILRACKANSIPSNWLKLLARYPAKVMEFLHG